MVTALDVLQGSLAAWRSTKHPRFAALAGWATARLLAESPREALPLSTRAADAALWQRTFEAKDALDVPRLLAALATNRSAIAVERVKLLATLEDPRVVSGLLAWLEAPPFRAGTAQPFFRAVCAALAESGDPRVKPALEDLAGRYKGIIETSIGDIIAGLLARTAKGLKDPAAPRLSAAQEEQAAAWEALFEEERRSSARNAGAKQAAVQSDEALLAAIYAAPDDDGPRLVFADTLTERGDPRGEFIALQVARAQGAATPAMRLREWELLGDPKRRSAWALPLSMGGDVTLQRGFPAGLTLSAREGKRVVGQEALRTVTRLTGLREAPLKVALELLRGPQLAHLQHLGWLQERHLEQLEGQFPWPSLALDFAPGRSTLERFPALRTLELTVAPPGALLGGERLTSLKLHGGKGFVPTLLSSVPELRSLLLWGFVGDWASLGSLRAAPKLETVWTRSPPPPSLLEGSAVKDFTTGWVRDLPLEALMRAAPALRRFSLLGNFVPAEAQALALSVARELGLEALDLGLARLLKPYTGEGVAEVNHPRANLKNLGELLAGLGTEVVTKVVLRPAPSEQNYLPPLLKVEELEALRKASPVPLEVEWY